MATQELRKRANWQTESGSRAIEAEVIFQIALQSALNQVYPGKFIVERHPSEFNDIYSRYSLPESVLEEIYNVA